MIVHKAVLNEWLTRSRKKLGLRPAYNLVMPLWSYWFPHWWKSASREKDKNNARNSFYWIFWQCGCSCEGILVPLAKWIGYFNKECRCFIQFNCSTRLCSILGYSEALPFSAYAYKSERKVANVIYNIFKRVTYDWSLSILSNNVYSYISEISNTNFTNWGKSLNDSKSYPWSRNDVECRNLKLRI